MLSVAFLEKRLGSAILPCIFPGSAAVAQLAVNELVVGSNPTRGARNCWTLTHVVRVLQFLSIGRIRRRARGTHRARWVASSGSGRRKVLTKTFRALGLILPGEQKTFRRDMSRRSRFSTPGRIRRESARDPRVRGTPIPGPRNFLTRRCSKMFLGGSCPTFATAIFERLTGSYPGRN
jgi:hypothetical protein